MAQYHQWSVKLYVTDDFRRHVTALASIRKQTLSQLICELLLGELRLVGSLDFGDVDYAVPVGGKSDHAVPEGR